MRTRSLPVIVAVLGIAAYAQTTGSFNPVPGIDLSGNWAPVFHEDQPERIPGPELVNYLGLPITDGARQWALAWDASRLTLPEHQCQVHVAPYIYRGPLNLRIWEEKDVQSQRVLAIHQYISTYEQFRTIWMDNRPHPPEAAAHTWMGFSTGKWEGNILTVYTTHIKQGWVRRDGLPESDQATLVEHFIRHGDRMTHVSVVTDPVYLTEPLIKSEDFQLQLQEGQNWLYPCEYVDEIANRSRGAVPNYLPGQNPFLHEFADKYKIPVEAALGGAETMYPEYQRGIKAAPLAMKAPAAPPATGELTVLPVQGRVYMINGAGGNIAVQIGDMGIVVVDTGLAQNADKVIAAIRRLSDKPIQYIINTHFHADHTGGNPALRRAGVTITGANVTGNLSDAGVGAAIIAHENVMDRLSAPTGKAAAAPPDAWPTDTYVVNQKELYFNEEPIEIKFQPKAHTDGDSLVMFRHSDVIATGDIFNTTSFPFIDIEHGGSIQGEIDALNNILDLAVPKHDEEGGTYILPGHGRICDEFDVLEYRDMVTILRDRVQAAIKKGQTLDQVKAAHLTVDYDARYNKAGIGSADTFIESVYKSLTAR
jgi:glyoxylase-like metal-dependent hydrolase (beta-lactamase superfamily II)